MSDLPPAGEPRPHRDRYVGLVCFGVLELLLGLLALLLLGSMVLVATLAPKPAPGMEPKALIQAMLTYLGAAVFFIWMGVGSILARRWARALLLVASWLWLFTGVLACASLFLLFPHLQESMARSAPGGATAPEVAQVTGVIQGCAFGALAVLFVALPLAFVLFYGRRDVRATCEVRDPQPRWTDRCPLPVLGLSLLDALGAASLFALGFAYRVFPIFGGIVSGWPAVAVSVGAGLVLAVVARATYQVKSWAWWTTLALWLVGAASAVFTFLRPFDWQELYRLMGIPAEQYQQMGLQSFWELKQWPWLMMLSLLPALAYLVWVRRFFVRPGGAAGGDAAWPAGT